MRKQGRAVCVKMGWLAWVMLAIAPNTRGDLLVAQIRGFDEPLSSGSDCTWNGVVKLDEVTGATNLSAIVSCGILRWEYAHKGTVGPAGDFFLPGGGLLNDEVLRFSGSSGQEIGRMIAGAGINIYAVAFDSEHHFLVLGVAYDIGSGLAWKGDNVWVYECFGGQLQRVVSIPKLDPNSPNTFNDIVSLPDGGIIVSDEYHGLRWSPPDSDSFELFVQTGSHVVTNATGMALGPDGNLYVSSGATDEIFRFDVHSYPNSPSSEPSFPLIDVFVPSGRGGLKTPGWLTFCSDGNLYAYSQGTSGILRYNIQTGAFIDSFVKLSRPVNGGIHFSPPLPVIRSKKTQGGLALEWSQSWSNYVAERTVDPTDTNGWTPIIVGPSSVGGNWIVTNTISADHEFFRLRRTD